METIKTEIKEQIEGYKDLQKESEVLRKYAADLTTERGQVFQSVNYLHPKSLNLKVANPAPHFV